MAYIYTKRECCKSAKNILFTNDSLLWKRRCLSLNFKNKKKEKKTENQSKYRRRRRRKETWWNQRGTCVVDMRNVNLTKMTYVRHTFTNFELLFFWIPRCFAATIVATLAVFPFTRWCNVETRRTSSKKFHAVNPPLSGTEFEITINIVVER